MGLLETLADALTRKASSKAEYGTPSPELTQQMRSGGLTGGLLRAANPMVWDENSSFAQWARKPAGSPMGKAALDEILNGPVMGTFGGIGKKGVPGYVEDAAQREANFKKWFGDSKVVDAEGKPLTVYHGSDANIDAFSPGTGHFTGDRSGVASSFAGESGSVYPVNLSINNPIKVQDPGFWGGSALMNQLVEQGVLTREEAASLMAKGRASSGNTSEKFANIMDDLGSRGYDGFVYDNTFEGGGLAYKPFKPTQIKSIFNRGTYDPTDPNILKSLLPAAATTYGIDQVLPYD